MKIKYGEIDFYYGWLLNNLKLSGKKLGILVNFNCTDIDKSIFRKVNKL